MNTLELSRKHPEAFKALPEAYQNDDVLEFWIEEEELYARPLDNQVDVLGDWNSRFDQERHVNARSRLYEHALV